MFEWTPRLVAAVVLVVVAISALAMLGGGDPVPPDEPTPGSFGSQNAGRVRPKGASGGARPGGRFAGGGSVGARPLPRVGAGTVRGPEGGISEGRLTGAGENTVESNEGRVLGTEREVAANPRAGGFSAGEAEFGPAPGEDGLPTELPEGTTLAIPLTGSSEGVDATQPIIDENVYYDLKNGAYFAPDARLAYADRGGVSNDAGTISFWLKPSWDGNALTDNSFIQLRTSQWDNRMHVFKNGVFLRFLIADDDGIEHNVGGSIAGWKADTWHHVAVTWGPYTDGEDPEEAITILYLDGARKEHNIHRGSLAVPQGTPLYVGSDRSSGGTPGANAVMSNLRVMETALGGNEINDLYHSTQPVE